MDEAACHAAQVVVHTVPCGAVSRPSRLPADAQGDGGFGRAHKVLDLPWTGLTMFRTREMLLSEEKVESWVDTEPPLGVLQGGELK